MIKAIRLSRPSGIVVMTATMALLLLYGAGLHGYDETGPVDDGKRADVITIDTMKVFGELEKGPVAFLHDAHTSALAKKNKDCTACHAPADPAGPAGYTRVQDTLRFQMTILSKLRKNLAPSKDDPAAKGQVIYLKRLGRDEVINAYHQQCISCHGEMRLSGDKTGPVACDDCHQAKTRHIAARAPVGFDASLHFRHSRSQENKCETCHHEFDEKTKDLVPAKGREGSCRYCHLPDAKSDTKVTPFRLAAHAACISCHQETAAKNIKTGPVTCAGCHDPAAWKKIQKISPVPRMERNQPDALLLKPVSTLGNREGGLPVGRMPATPFDHKAHEAYNDTCRVCHHGSLKPCRDCHVLEGKEAGGGVSLEKAMHQAGALRSCLGCHDTRKKSPDCAGCHLLMGRSSGQTLSPSDNACKTCHFAPDDKVEKATTPKRERKLADRLLHGRKPVEDVLEAADGPEKVVIGGLAKDYEAVDFPHRKIARALADRIKDNPLAVHFHQGPGALCQGCHHNSPASKTPPRCNSCHGPVPDVDQPLKPGILGAYHQQCMGCHQEMNIEKPMGCTECHAKRPKTLTHGMH